MKRLMTALLAAVMTVTMAGTALAAEDPAALLERVTQKANELDSMDCDLGVHAVMVMQDPEMDLDLSLNLDMMMNMKMDQIKSGNLRYKADMAMEFLARPNMLPFSIKTAIIIWILTGRRLNIRWI